MSEIKSNIPTKQATERSFGVVFAIVFLILALYPLLNSNDIRIWALILSTLFLILAILFPSTLEILNKLWFRFGMLVGSIIAPIVMAIVYFLTVLPTGIIMRLLGKDLLSQKLDKSSKSYWIKRDEKFGSMKNQF